MQVFALTNSDRDLPHWISRSVFFSYFDQEDFHNREVRNVKLAYRRDWFEYLEEGRVGFYLPVVGAIGDKTDLIGTRHRLAVLLPHMEEIPMAFSMQVFSSESRNFLLSIPKRALSLNEPFWIPDFPIYDSLP